mmetsp:Transcript_16928/g.27432  ORF Transcript_16928/g.27432 Transcript_16928/m.27432 type:complete len:83 (+) Transcript_16928:1-249(+)
MNSYLDEFEKNDVLRRRYSSWRSRTTEINKSPEDVAADPLENKIATDSNEINAINSDITDAPAEGETNPEEKESQSQEAVTL